MFIRCRREMNAGFVLSRIMKRSFSACVAVLAFTAPAFAQVSADPPAVNVPVESALEQLFEPMQVQLWFDHCRAEADSRTLRGSDRRDFYVVCLARTHAAPLEVWAECLKQAEGRNGLALGTALSACVSMRGGVPARRAEEGR